MHPWNKPLGVAGLRRRRTSDERPATRRDGRLPNRYVDSVLVFALALAVRLAVSSCYRFEGMDCDAAGYYNLARHFAAGQGWTNYSLRLLFSLPQSIPMPDDYWSPFFPFLLSGSFSLFGTSFASAKLVTVLLGGCVGVLGYLLGRELTGSRRAGLISGCLLAVHPIAVDWSLRIMSEVGTMSAVMLVFVLLFSGRWRARPWVIGAAAGLAYLTKYQSVLLWPALLVGLWSLSPRGTRSGRVGWALLSFLIVVSPWFLRNLAVFGDPLHTVVTKGMLAKYPRFGGENKVFTRLVAPPGFLSFLLAHPGEVAAQAWVGSRVVVFQFFRSVAGPVWLYPAAILGFIWMVRKPRVWGPFLVYAFCLYAAVSLCIPNVRYMLSLLPLWLVLAGIGFDRALTRAGGGKLRTEALRWGGVALLALAVGSSVLQVRSRAIGAGGDWRPGVNFCSLEGRAMAELLQGVAGPDEPVFGEEQYHDALLFDRMVIQVPYDETTLQVVRDRYHLRYMAITRRGLSRRFPGWTEALPGWVHPVAEMPAREVARRGGHPEYSPVSDVLLLNIECAPAADSLEAG